MKGRGKVFLVGAGPGDPGLITVKGLKCIAQADVIVYDRLIDKRLLEKAGPCAELIYAGKASQDHALPQREINSLLVAKAKEGKIVTRLKGGDPFLFGRGGEEAEALVEHGILFEVVPGVSSAVAVPAYAGIPVTHRHLASSVAIVTGHEDPSKGEAKIGWEKLATAADTLVLLMAMENLPSIVESLVKSGRSQSTPIALIRWGTGPQQETLVGTLADIAATAEEAGFGAPAVAVIGDVVNLREHLRWFDNKPLFGKQVLVTRSRKQASVLSELLAEQGAQPIELSTIETQPPANYAALDNALSHLSRYDWIVFTSANGVDGFFCRLREQNKDVRAVGSVEFCTIGPATVKALEKYGITADCVPQDYSTDGLLAEFKGRDITGARFLLPRAEDVTEDLASGLAHLGAEVEEVAAYRTVPASEIDPLSKQMLLDGNVDIVTFTSSSTVRNLATLLGDRLTVLGKAMVACIGPVTASTAVQLGIRVDIIAKEHTIAGLVKALLEGCNANKREG